MNVYKLSYHAYFIDFWVIKLYFMSMTDTMFFNMLCRNEDEVSSGFIF